MLYNKNQSKSLGPRPFPTQRAFAPPKGGAFAPPKGGAFAPPKGGVRKKPVCNSIGVFRSSKNRIKTLLCSETKRVKRSWITTKPLLASDHPLCPWGLCPTPPFGGAKAKRWGLERLVLQFSTFSCSPNAINASLRLLNSLMHSVSKKQLNPFSSPFGRGERRKGKGSDLMHARHLNSLSTVNVQLKNTRYTKSRTRFTVIRSPFVFKKTREQFTRLHTACTVVLPTTKPQQQFLLQLLTTSKFPAELSVLSHA
jgi:ribosomal protein S10